MLYFQKQIVQPLAYIFILTRAKLTRCNTFPFSDNIIVSTGNSAPFPTHSTITTTPTLPTLRGRLGERGDDDPLLLGLGEVYWAVRDGHVNRGLLVWWKLDLVLLFQPPNKGETVS